MIVGRTRKRRRRDPKILPFMPRNIVELPGRRSRGDEFVPKGPELRPATDRREQLAADPSRQASRYRDVDHLPLGFVGFQLPCGSLGSRSASIPASQKWTDHLGRDHHVENHGFLSDRAQRDFEEAAIRAVRAMIRKANDWPATETERASLRQAEERAQRALRSREVRGYSVSRWEEVRKRIFVRDEFTCQDCGEKAAELWCTHVVPPSEGGDDSDDNLITRSRACGYLAQKERKARTQPSGDDCPF
jgi:5-methylcytosine-specific restriction endonuclease McrA